MKPSSLWKGSGSAESSFSTAYPRAPLTGQGLFAKGGGHLQLRHALLPFLFCNQGSQNETSRRRPANSSPATGRGQEEVRSPPTGTEESPLAPNGPSGTQLAHSQGFKLCPADPKSSLQRPPCP